MYSAAATAAASVHTGLRLLAFDLMRSSCCLHCCNPLPLNAALQSMTGEGVLQWIDDTELNSWAQAVAVRAAVAGLAAGDAALATFQQGGAAATQPAPFQVRGLPCCGEGWLLLAATAAAAASDC